MMVQVCIANGLLQLRNPKKEIAMDDDKLLLQMTSVFEKKLQLKVKEFVDSILMNPEIAGNSAVECAALGGISCALSKILQRKFEEIEKKLGVNTSNSMN